MNCENRECWVNDDGKCDATYADPNCVHIIPKPEQSGVLPRKVDTLVGEMETGMNVEEFFEKYLPVYLEEYKNLSPKCRLSTEWMQIFAQDVILEYLDVVTAADCARVAEMEGAIVNIFKLTGGKRVARECRRVLPDVCERAYKK